MKFGKDLLKKCKGTGPRSSKSVSIDILDYPKGLKCTLDSNVLVTAEAMNHASVKCVRLILSLRGTITGIRKSKNFIC